MTLTLADDLKLSPDVATQTFLVVGKRGSGKSNTAARMAEEFVRAAVPFVVIDPVDNWVVSHSDSRRLARDPRPRQASSLLIASVGVAACRP